MLKYLKLELDQLAAAKKLREFHLASGHAAGRLDLRGRKVLDFTNWDYLNLRNNARLKHVAHSAIERLGLSSGASRLGSGTQIEHVGAEETLSRFLGLPGALLFSSRNQALLTLVTAVCGEGDVVFWEEGLQAPVADAAFLVNAQAIAFTSARELESELEKIPLFRRKLVVAEALSPVTGKLGDLTALQRVAQKYEAGLVVDETCGIGLLGLRGAGGCERLNLSSSIFAQFGSLGYGLNTYAGFVAGDSILISYLLNRSRTFHLEVSPPPYFGPLLEGMIDSIELAAAPRDFLNLLSRKLRQGLMDLGFAGLDLSETAVICLNFKSVKVASEFGEALFQKGFLVDTFSYPRPLFESGVVRFILNSQHTEQDVDELLVTLAGLKSRLDLDV